MTDDDLVKRLRAFTEDDAYAQPWTFGLHVNAAADLIEDLQRERDGLREKLEVAEELAHADGTRADRLAARLKEAEEALRPFDRIAGEVFAKNYNNRDVVADIGGWHKATECLYAEDFFAVRALLARLAEETPPDAPSPKQEE